MKTLDNTITFVVLPRAYLSPGVHKKPGLYNSPFSSTKAMTDEALHFVIELDQI